MMIFHRVLLILILLFLTDYSISQENPISFADCQKENINCNEIKILKNEEFPTYADEKWDACCSRIFLKKFAPHGVITVLGSSRLSKTHPAYRLIFDFSVLWSKQPQSNIWPIASGGGSGLMEAANRGAKEKTIGLTVLFQNPHNPTKSSQFIPKEKNFIYRNLTKRESDLIDLSKAVVIGLGGVGTTWELMETASKIQSLKKPEVPIILLGTEKQWESIIYLIRFLTDNNTVSKNDCQLFNITPSPAKAVQLILMNTQQRKKDSTSMCLLSTWRNPLAGAKGETRTLTGFPTGT